MTFELSTEQALLSDTVGRILGSGYDLARRKAYLSTTEGWGRDIWQSFAEAGLLGLPFAEEFGGSDGGPAEAMIVMEGLGRALALEPYLSTVLLGGSAIRLGDSLALKRTILPAVSAGDLTLAFAHEENHRCYDPDTVELTAEKFGNRWRLNGRKVNVVDGCHAHKLVVSARLHGQAGDREGLALFVVDRNQPGVETERLRAQDGRRPANITFRNVDAAHDDAVVEPGHAGDLIRRVLVEGTVGLCSEAIGVLLSMHEDTLSHIKTRTQFGVPLASFQVLQHRVVDMLVSLEQARSMVIYAVGMAGESTSIRGRAAAAAKIQVGRASRFVSQQAVQLHGGMGVTLELKVGHGFLRAAAIEIAFGDWRFHLRNLRDGGVPS